MKIAIVFSSNTGNTEYLAQGIKEVVQKNDLVYFGKFQEGIDADLYFVGSWTDKGCCSEEIKSLLSSLKNKKIAYFQTAGFGGSQAYFKRPLDTVMKLIDSSNEFLGSYFCQGRMPDSVKNRYLMMLEKNPNDERILASLDNFEKAKSHPDFDDLKRIKEWAHSMIDTL